MGQNLSSWQEKLTAGGGSLIIDDTNAHTGLVGLTISPREDTVLSVCTGFDGNGTAVDFMTEFNWDGTLLVTDILIVPDNYYIESVTLTSGSIILYQ